MKHIWILIGTILVTGCTSLSEQYRQGFDSNRSDDEYCVKQGLHYPDPAYVACRRSLQNTRLFRAWQGEQMRRASANPAGPAAGGSFAPHTGGFRPIDAAHYRCQVAAEYGGDVITCAETESPPR